MADLLHFVVLVGLALVACTSDVMTLSEDAWVDVARCRAQCAQRFLPMDVSSSITDRACKDSSNCYMCWEMCELIQSDSWSYVCEPSSAAVCPAACRSACQWRTGHIPPSTGQVSVNREWKFPLSGEFTLLEDDRLVLAWQRPRYHGNNDFSTAMVFLIKRQTGAHPIMTLDFWAEVADQDKDYRDTTFQVLAVGEEGLLATTTLVYPPRKHGRPASNHLGAHNKFGLDLLIAETEPTVREGALPALTTTRHVTVAPSTHPSDPPHTYVVSFAVSFYVTLTVCVVGVVFLAVVFLVIFDKCCQSQTSLASGTLEPNESQLDQLGIPSYVDFKEPTPPVEVRYNNGVMSSHLTSHLTSRDVLPDPELFRDYGDIDFCSIWSLPSVTLPDDQSLSRSLLVLNDPYEGDHCELEFGQLCISDLEQQDESVDLEVFSDSEVTGTFSDFEVVIDISDSEGPTVS